MENAIAKKSTCTGFGSPLCRLLFLWKFFHVSRAITTAKVFFSSAIMIAQKNFKRGDMQN